MAGWVRIGSVLGAAVLVLSACGGGGGGGSAGPAAPQSIDGSATELSPAGGIQPAAGGRTVELQSIDSAGAVRTTLATTATDSAGRFRIDVPPTSQLGWSLALSISHGDGSRSRAFAFDTEADIGPASEALFRLLLDGPTAAQAGTDPIGRLGRFQRAVVTFLNLLEPRSRTSERLIDELQRWLRDDPASKAALRELRQSGRLPGTLGDIGGLFGMGRAGWVWQDSADGERTFVIRQSATDPNIYESFDTIPVLPGEFPKLGTTARSRWRLVDDQLEVSRDYLPPGSTAAEQLANEFVSGLRLSRFGERTGAVRHTTYLPRKTIGVTFDADQLEDDISREVDTTVRGAESIAAFGTQVRSLRIDYEIKTTIQLSAGGSIEIVENRTDWCVPYAGIVRTQSTFLTTDAAGRKFGSERNRSLQRGVLNDTSWPGRVHVTRIDRVAFSNLVPIVGIDATPDGKLLFVGKDEPSIFRVDPDTGQVLAERTVPSTAPWLPRFQLSPDRTKLYYFSAATRFSGSPSNSLFSTPLADANAAGGLLIRYDALTLQEELRVTLPAHPSSVVSGHGFARRNVVTMAISSSDATQALIDTDAGVMLLRGDTFAPLTMVEPTHEKLFLENGLLDAGGTSLLAWDGNRAEVYALHFPPWPAAGSYVVIPISVDGPELARSRPGVEFSISRANDAVFGNRLFLFDFGYVFDTATGAKLGQSSLARSPTLDFSALYDSRCAYDRDDIVCQFNDGLYRLSPNDLSTQTVLSYQSTLRSLSGNTVPGGGSFKKLADGEFVSLRNGQAFFSPIAVIDRIRL